MSAIKRRRSSLPEEDLTCPVCCDIFHDPVIQQCSHSICKGCLHKYWDIKKCRECPVCRHKSPKGELPRNLALKNLCDAFLKIGSNEDASELCSLHGESFKLFCVDDKEPVCVVCQTSRAHKDHMLCPISEAVIDYKEELNTALSPLQERLTLLQDVKKTYDQTSRVIKSQAQLTEGQIKEEFKRLRKHLQEEESSRVEALRAEERRKTDAIRKKTQELSAEIKTVSDTIQAIKEELKQDDVAFVQNFKTTLEKTKCSSKVPEMFPDALLDVANHLGNLGFKVWKKMQDIIEYAPVILDPNTAGPHLVMTKELTSVIYSDDAGDVPDNLERFDFYHCVLGKEGFDSGRHHWDVEVGDNSLWYLGIINESNCHKIKVLSHWDVEVGDNSLWSLGIINESNCHKGQAIWNGVWSLWYAMGEYKIQSPQQVPTTLAVAPHVRRLRVTLDWDRGEVSFHDALMDTCLCSMTHTFTEKVFPFFYNFCVRAPLQVVTEKPVVVVD